MRQLLAGTAIAVALLITTDSGRAGDAETVTPGAEVPAAAIEAGQVMPSEIYSSGEHGWTIGYPADWEVEDSNPATVKFTSPFASVSVLTRQVRITDPYRLVSSMIRRNNKRRSGYVAKARKKGRLSDGTTYLRFIGVDDELGSLTLVAVDGTTLYMLKMETDAATLPHQIDLFDRMAKSFTLSDLGGEGGGDAKQAWDY